ncbi:hypothetical protein K1T71_014428 [Dendrolimus kikuchii]|uniref:Uncharacterized protein n=1 Tax=Dendrolimus kikuchii TaxID=765133 RepID=A0ACC1CEC6_9NEOP|nr:hypothetical protein K1T71_014428 [Dendrolimus kikuchii]
MRVCQIHGNVCKILSILAATHCQNYNEIIRNDRDGPHPDGSYRWAFETGGGIYHEQRGFQRDTGLQVEGQYQYTAPDGQVINVLYKADENGFHATGDHIPTPPPIPIAIQRALDYLKSRPSTTERY